MGTKTRQQHYNDIITASVNDYLKKYPNATETELKRKTQKKYENGWNNRLKEFKNRGKNEANVNCK